MSALETGQNSYPEPTAERWRELFMEASAELERLRARWQPIETAPKNKTVQLWHRQWGKPATGHHLAGDLWGVFVPGLPMMHQPHLNPAPTHWQPLHEPSKEAM